MDGILLIDKPTGWTSHDVVAKVRGILRQAAASQQIAVNSQQLTTDDLRLTTTSPKVKVGHTGTLDPMATGLLILVLGSYTKRAGEFSKLDKVYEAELILGATSSTGDAEGQITHTQPLTASLFGRSSEKEQKEKVREAVKSFEGKIMQVPHRYSAVKVGGKRAYKLARAGQEVKLEPREVTIYKITNVEYNYPKLKFAAKVSSGTYIRSLAEDIGETLGTGAYLSALRRTQIGQYDIKNTLKIEDVSSENIVLIKV